MKGQLRRRRLRWLSNNIIHDFNWVLFCLCSTKELTSSQASLNTSTATQRDTKAERTCW